MKLSVVIIAKNEESMIGKALESAGWADELVVVDSRSIDRTAQIARKFGAKVYQYSGEGSFDDWREYGAKKARGEWIFYLDADERISDGLREDIKELVYGKQTTDYSGYDMPRQNVLLGHPMKHGGWWPDKVLRLIKKDKLKGYEGQLHEQPKIDGRVGSLEGHLVHITHRSLSEMIEKTNKWSEIEAKLMFDAGHPPMNTARFLSAMFREFWYRAVVKLGFLDGVVGVIEIVYQVFSRFVSYAKLWEMQDKSQTSKVKSQN